MTTAALPVDRRWQQLRKLTEVSRALTYAISLRDVLELTVNRASELLETDRAVLMLTNEDGLLVVRASCGLDKDTCDRFREPLHETLLSRLQGLLGESAADHFMAVPLVVGGEVTGLLAVARPHIPDRHDEEEWLLSALADQAAVALEKTRLDETAVFRERLLGIVSHDLRNPVSAISMAARVLLQREDLDDSATTTIVRIQRSATRATRMIEDLLDFTQARLGGGIPVHPKGADLQAIIRHAAEELQLAKPDRTLNVSFQGDSRGEWDPDRIAQAFGNVIANAVYYSPAGTTISIDAVGTRDEVTVAVHNDGAPISAERLPHIFEPMQRARSEINNAGRSVGLGLFIVKHIVGAHGGSVSVDSTAEAGTTFTICLPRWAARAA